MRSPCHAIIYALQLLAIASHAVAQVPTGHRYWSLRANADDANRQDQYRWGWNQAESVTIDVSITSRWYSIQPHEDRTVEWRMTDLNDIDQVYFAQTGTVHDGRWRFNHEPDGTAFAPGRYAGYVRTWMVDGSGNVTQNLVAAQMVLTIGSSPGFEDVPVIGPITSTNFIRIPDPWPDGHLITRIGGEVVAVSPTEGSGATNVAVTGGGSGNYDAATRTINLDIDEAEVSADWTPHTLTWAPTTTITRAYPEVIVTIPSNTWFVIDDGDTNTRSQVTIFMRHLDGSVTWPNNLTKNISIITNSVNTIELISPPFRTTWDGYILERP